MFRFTRKEHEDRTAAARKDCNDLVNSSRMIIDQVESLHKRIDILEETMGVYSAKEKHKFWSLNNTRTALIISKEQTNLKEMHIFIYLS